MAGETIAAESDVITGTEFKYVGTQVCIYASPNIDTQPTFKTYLDKGDTTTVWNTTWPDVTYVQTAGTDGTGTIGFWYSTDAVTWIRSSSTNWGAGPLTAGGIGTEAYRYVAFNADPSGATANEKVGYISIPDPTGLTVVLVDPETTRRC